MKFSLLAITDVNEKEQQLTAKGFFYLTWNDVFLTWNVTEYQVEEMIMDSSQIWVPDLGFTFLTKVLSKYQAVFVVYSEMSTLVSIGCTVSCFDI
jgi:hypothetical protein